MEKNLVRLQIQGMTCAACSASIEKALNRKKSVETAVVNLATNVATINTDGTITTEELIKLIERIGFKAEIYKEEIKKEKYRISTNRLIVALVFGFIELYIGMSHMLPIELPLPSIISMEENPLAFALVQLVLTTIVLIAGYQFFTSGVKKLVTLHPNMDSLVAIGTGSAFFYSIYNTFLASQGNTHAVHSLYYESAAVVVALVLLGKYLEERSKSKAKKAITALASLVPGTAIVEREGKELEVPTRLIQKGEIVIVKPGERIAVDGEIIHGESGVDESMLTGESLPVYKKLGSKVSSGTICKDGYIKISATEVGSDTAIAQVINMVTQAQERKAPSARLADKVAGVFVPTVIVIAIVSAIIWFLLGKDIAFVMNIFVSVLVVACPCALGLATPIAVMAGSGRGANLGILYKGGDVIEEASKVNLVFFDKTGTLTKGELKIEEIISTNKDIEGLIKLVASAELASEHPIANAIVAYAKDKDIQLVNPDKLTAYPGRGVKANILEDEVLVGTITLLEAQSIVLPSEVLEIIKTNIGLGLGMVFVAINGVYEGMITLTDTIREDSKKAVNILNHMNITTGMLTGDNRGVAGSVAKEIGIDTFRAEVLPQDKAMQVELEKKNNLSVMMVGDGINDAPALATSNVGVAVFGGTDVAGESAGIILMRDDMTAVADAIALSKKTMVIIRENLFWAFIYNCIGIPLAAGVVYSMGGPLLTPAFAGGAMALSSVCVVTNALRLTRFTPKHRRS